MGDRQSLAWRRTALSRLGGGDNKSYRSGKNTVRLDGTVPKLHKIRECIPEWPSEPMVAHARDLMVSFSLDLVSRFGLVEGRERLRILLLAGRKLLKTLATPSAAIDIDD
jgi:hypothetical protein